MNTPLHSTKKKHYWGLPMFQGWWDGVVKSFKAKDNLGAWVWWQMPACISW
jgi:hypothetical protein